MGVIIFSVIGLACLIAIGVDYINRLYNALPEDDKAELKHFHY